MTTDTTKQAIGRYWGERAATFDEESLHSPATEAEWQAWDGIARLLTNGREGLDVLDAGTGTGFLALLFAERGDRATGTDLAPEMVERAKAKAAQRGLPALFQVEDAEAMRLPDASFDLVVSRHLLWTLPHPEHAVAEWVRLARPGGRIAVLDGQWDVPWPGEQDEPEAPREKVYEREVVQALPFYGGAPAERVAGVFRDHGLRDVRIQPLDELVAAEHARLVAAGKPAHPFIRYAIYGDVR